MGGLVRCMYDFVLNKHPHAERPEGEAWSCKSYLHFYDNIMLNRPSLLHFDLSFIILLCALVRISLRITNLLFYIDYI